MMKPSHSPWILALLISLVLGGATASFQAKAAVSKCATIDVPSLLLDCYNKLMKDWKAKRSRNVKKSSYNPHFLSELNIRCPEMEIIL